ncbi:hypothetical protein GCM10027059_15070 [Myceligenerans halotolerans]
MRSQFATLFGTSTTMMLRSRGVVLVMVAIPTYVIVYALLDVDWRFGAQRVDLFDFVLPGLAAFAAAHILLDTAVAVGAIYKARGVLTRLAVTPVSAPLLITVQMLTYTILGVVTGAAMLLAGALAGAHVEITPNLLWLVPLLALVMFTNMGLAFTIAGLMPNPASANQLSSGLGMPLMFLSGAMLPLDVLPGALPDIARIAVPFASPIEAMRGIVLDGAPITQYGAEVLIAATWAVAMLAAATAAYRFDHE